MSDLSTDAKERIDAFIDGAIDRQGVVNYIPSDKAGADAAVAYVEAKHPGGLSNGASDDQLSKVREMLNIIEGLRFLELIRMFVRPDEGKPVIGFSPETIARWKATQDEKFRQWKARDREI